MTGLRHALKEYFMVHQIAGSNPILAFDNLKQQYVVFWYFKKITIIFINFVLSSIHLEEKHISYLSKKYEVKGIFGLTDYSKNNIHKCISSYFYGIYLYHKYYDDISLLRKKA